MAHSEPDIAELFAPLRPADASEVVLSEARQMLARLREPIDAELWGSDLIGALTRPAAGADQAVGGDQTVRSDQAPDRERAVVLAELARSLVPAVERSASPEAVALLRVLGVLGTPELRVAATAAADRLTAAGTPDPAWAAAIGKPKVGRCWHYSDVGGRHESVTLTFGYGAAEHALSVLIDHSRGGKLKDAWVDNAAGLLDKTWFAAENDPLVIFDSLAPDDARGRLARAVAAGEGPVKPDEADDLAAHRALLHARIRHLASA
jgi:hypothetical protein